MAEMFQSTSKLFRQDYGGELVAYSFQPASANIWLNQFRLRLKETIGKKYLPVYRMADGEYQFLFGLKFNFHAPNIFRYLVSFLIRKTLEIFTGPRIKTSWGETYSGIEIQKLRTKYKNELKILLENGILCAYLYDNPKNAFTYYNRTFLNFFENNALELNKSNFFPFHFPFFALSDEGWQEFIIGRSILIVTGNLEIRRNILEKNLTALGSKKVGFYEVSANASLRDLVDKNLVENIEEYEIAFIGAGIGSLNIISQMTWFKGPVIDVGGFISALLDKNYLYHGGAVKFPGFSQM
jgi:hypothetical protein